MFRHQKPLFYSFAAGSRGLPVKINNGYPAAMNREPDCIGKFSLMAADKGGRSAIVRSGYKPQHLILDNYQTSGKHEYVGVDQVAPGESADVKVWFITPEVYPKSLWPGRDIGVYEGSKRVGSLLITQVLNPSLEGIPESFNPVWTPPAS